MGSATFSWQVLKTLSNYAFVVMIVIGVLDWYNQDQIELVINDAIAKAYWLQIKNLYLRLGWFSLILMVGLRLSYWILEFIGERRVMASRKGD